MINVLYVVSMLCVCLYLWINCLSRMCFTDLFCVVVMDKCLNVNVADGKIVGDVIILGEYDVRNDIVNDTQKVI